jgi:hypothetical protein
MYYTYFNRAESSNQFPEAYTLFKTIFDDDCQLDSSSNKFCKFVTSKTISLEFLLDDFHRVINTFQYQHNVLMCEWKSDGDFQTQIQSRRETLFD